MSAVTQNIRGTKDLYGNSIVEIAQQYSIEVPLYGKCKNSPQFSYKAPQFSSSSLQFPQFPYFQYFHSSHSFMQPQPLIWERKGHMQKKTFLLWKNTPIVRLPIFFLLFNPLTFTYSLILITHLLASYYLLTYLLTCLTLITYMYIVSYYT